MKAGYYLTVIFIGSFFIIASLSSCKGIHPMGIEQSNFGNIDGKEVDLYTLANKNGMVVKITNYGGIVTELIVPDRNGNFSDVVLGFESLEGYLEGHPYFGAMVGRVANRIAKGEFRLGKETYTLATNNGPNHLHGGDEGFDKKIWDARPLNTREGPALKLSYLSEDGEEGYPGNLKVTVIYTLTNTNELMVHISAETDKTTIVNIAHHSYWNLAGQDSGSILSHELMINADYYTPTDGTLIPTGEIASVEGTPYDFRKAKTIGKDIKQLTGDTNSDDPGGYDINYVLNGVMGELNLAARALEPQSGRIMEVYSTEPGLQFYSGNFLDGSLRGKKGTVYNKHQGFCLETQHYPDSINKLEWPPIELFPGERYNHVMVHKFFIN